MSAPYLWNISCSAPRLMLSLRLSSTFSLSLSCSCCDVSMQYSAVHKMLQITHCSSSLNLVTSPSFKMLCMRPVADVISERFAILKKSDYTSEWFPEFNQIHESMKKHFFFMMHKTNYHFLNQCWLIISAALQHLLEGNFSGNAEDIYHWYIWVWKLLQITCTQISQGPMSSNDCTALTWAGCWVVSVDNTPWDISGRFWPAPTLASLYSAVNTAPYISCSRQTAQHSSAEQCCPLKSPYEAHLADGIPPQIAQWIRLGFWNDI